MPVFVPQNVHKTLRGRGCNPRRIFHQLCIQEGEGQILRAARFSECVPLGGWLSRISIRTFLWRERRLQRMLTTVNISWLHPNFQLDLATALRRKEPAMTAQVTSNQGK